MKTLEDLLEEFAPKPDPGFVADMERRMRHGFPGPPRKSRLPRLALATLRPRAVAAVAASAVLALLVTVTLVSRDGDETADTPVALEALAPDQPPTAGSDGGGGDAATASEAPPRLAEPQPPPQVAPAAPRRRVEHSAQLTLASDPDEFDGLADSIFRTAERRDGVVLRSSFSQGEDGPAGGYFELRIPTAQLEPALNELSRLATVRARSESANDVTAAFVSLRDRLRTARAERKSLLRRLELAVTETAAVAIRRRLAIVGRTITSLRARLSAARERTAYSTVLVELVDEDSGGASAGETDEALDDAVGTLEDVLNFLIRALGVLLPVAFTALVVWLGALYARRRARDRALT